MENKFNGIEKKNRTIDKKSDIFSCIGNVGFNKIFFLLLTRIDIINILNFH